MHDAQCAHLGLMEPPDDARNTLIGTVEYDNGSWVEINATAFGGALFWTLMIYSREDDSVVNLETGTGPLSEFWPFASAIAEGMVKVVPIIADLTAEVEEVERLSREEPLPADRRLSLYRRIANVARASGHADSELRRGAVRMAWEARRELRQNDTQHLAE